MHQYTREERAHRAMWPVVMITIGAAAIFLVLVLLVSNRLISDLDEAILLSLREAGSPDNPLGPGWVEETLADFTALGGYPLLVPIGGIVICVLLLLRHRGAALFLFLSLAGGSIASTLLKQLFARPRPDLVAHADRVFTSSFPSAHAMVATVAWLTLAAITVRFVPRRSLRRFIMTMACIIAIIVGASRVYLGVHWPSDVLAGWAVGTAWAGCAWLTAHYLEHHYAAETDLGTSDT